MTSNRLTKHLGNAYSERMFCAFFSFSNFLVIIIVLNLLRLVDDYRTITNPNLNQTDNSKEGLEACETISPALNPFAKNFNPLTGCEIIYTPLRLTGGGETSFEYQENVSIENEENDHSVNAPAISTPARLPVCECKSPECVTDENSLPSFPELDPMPMADRFIVHPENLNPLADPFIPLLPDISFNDTTLTASIGNVSSSDENDPLSMLTGLKEKNQERPIIAHLNINSLSSKFEPFMSLIKDTIDFLLVTESKLDDTFPPDQFQIEGFSRPIRLDRNRNGGGLIIFVRDGLTCKELKPRKLYPSLECTFFELRIRQCKWLVVTGYNPHKDKIGNFLDRLSKEVDMHLPNYDNSLMLGDWNSAVTE